MNDICGGELSYNLFDNWQLLFILRNQFNFIFVIKLYVIDNVIINILKINKFIFLFINIKWGKINIYKFFIC